MSDIATVLETLKKVSDNQESLSKRLDDVQKSQEESRRNGPWGAPHARRGEDPFTSRGYSFLKAFGVISGHVDSENAKVEREVTDKLKKYYDSYGFRKTLPNSILIPFWSDALVGDDKLADEVRGVVKAGAGTLDPQEVAHLRRKMMLGGYTKALSWLDETAGGALVAPPAFGELIELLRNNEVLMQAGARVLPMPPQGRITFPRQTSAATAYHVGESVNLTESQQGTGDVVMQAKKLTVLNKIPNELFHFSAIPIEAFIREDMTKVIALKVDKTLLEDVGSSTVPKGLINYASINSFTSTDAGTTTNGYVFQPEDVALMVSKVESVNAEFKAFVMRPMMWASITNMRADSVAANDKKGPWMFNWTRDIGDDMTLGRMAVGKLSGYPVYKSTQIANNRVRSGGTDLTYVLGGDFADFLIAMGGALEFQVSTQGDTPFVADQTWFKGVMYYDGAPRHEASFVWCDNLCEDGVRN